LQALYLKEGFQVLYLPIPDFGVPTKDDLEQTAQQTIAYAQAGHHIVIHCSAGIGRTGLFTAYLAKRCLGLSGAEALQGCDALFPVLWKLLSNNSLSSMTMGRKGHRIDSHPSMSSHDVRLPPQYYPLPSVP
jgi:hypothetical protein